MKLNKCCICWQHWQIDVWDKYQTNCALKIDKPKNWQSFDDEPDRLKLLVETRGGLSEEKCVKQGCTNDALKSLAYCPIHAYKIGFRE
ncbi:MAG TPA: hypothetical protein VNI84_17465 [Pyrinomonadaceae bacterium]|nr:hypothetical protein [Pyrinomonadaceae bacterium]